MDQLIKKLKLAVLRIALNYAVEVSFLTLMLSVGFGCVENVSFPFFQVRSKACGLKPRWVETLPCGIKPQDGESQQMKFTWRFCFLSDEQNIPFILILIFILIR